MKNVQQKEKLFLFGAGVYGTSFLKFLNESGEIKNWEIIGFLDNNRERRHTEVDDIMIYGLDEVCNLVSGETYTVVITIKDPRKVDKQLRDAGICNIIYYYDFPEWDKYQSVLNQERECNYYKQKLKNRETELALVLGWLSLHAHNLDLSIYFKNRGLKKLVIYGVDKLGKILYQDLSRLSEVKVIGFVDENIKKNKECCGIPVYLPEELTEIEDVDMIVVSTVVSYEAIEKIIVSVRPEISLVSLETIIKECSIEELYENQ